MRVPILLLTAWLTLGACTDLVGEGTPPATAVPAAATTITGTLAYRERIALPADARVEVLLVDTARADAISPVLARQVFATDGRQVPLAFTLEAQLAGVAPRARPALRAVVRDGGGALLWTTDTHIPVALRGGRVDLGALRLVRARGGGNALPPGAVLFQCGETGVAARFHDGAMTLTLEGRDHRLVQEVAASGARYGAGSGATRIEFWNKGDEAMLTRGERTWPTCRTVADGAAEATYSARGQEPAWLLTVTAERLVLLLDHGTTRLAALRPERRAVAGGTQWLAQADGRSVSATIMAGICRDTMSGMPHPDTVTLSVGGRMLRGCGGEPASLLRGAWTVREIAGAAFATPRPVTLDFTDGRVTGQAPCNRFNAGYVLTGESLTIDRAAATMMACPPPVATAEQTFFAVLSAVQGFDMRADGALMLRAADDRTIVAGR